MKLLAGLNLELQEGTMVALLGQNGAGKSTLLKALTCSQPPLAGKLSVAGVNAAQLTQRQVSRLIGIVTTQRVMAGALTTRELVELGRQPYTGLLGRLGEHDHEIVYNALRQVGLTGKAGQYLAQLSDGERQKAMIARALAQQTPIIILDEPTAFLDAASRIETMQLLHSLAHEQGKAVLLSTHDISRSLLLTDELWLITSDRRLLAGPTESMVHSPAMNQVFASASVRFNPATCDYEAAQ